MKYVVMVILCCVLVGCSTPNPESVGRAVAIGHLMAGDRLPEENIKAVENAYMALEEISSQDFGNNLEMARVLVSDKLREDLEGLPLLLALEAVNKYWIILEDLVAQGEPAKDAIKDFIKGVRSVTNYGGK